MRELLLTEGRTQTHKFAVSQHANDLDFTSLLEIDDYLFDDVDPSVDKRIIEHSFCQTLNLFNFTLQLSLSASHNFIQLLFLLSCLISELFLPHSLDFGLNAVQINEAF